MAQKEYFSPCTSVVGGARKTRLEFLNDDARPSPSFSDAFFPPVCRSYKYWTATSFDALLTYGMVTFVCEHRHAWKKDKEVAASLFDKTVRNQQHQTQHSTAQQERSRQERRPGEVKRSKMTNDEETELLTASVEMFLICLPFSRKSAFYTSLPLFIVGETAEIPIEIVQS